MIDRSDTDWYRDAIIYQLHVKSFFDSNDDGVGDFEGVTRKLDYIKDLGVSAIWLMPFYPSPLRDDGYDIADYRGINPSYGTMRDFRRLVKEAHARGLRVITELVINHTSDQHPWFQKSRYAKPGSAARDFYVWSDTDQKYTGTRIIFLDTEPSNWSWDPVAKAYYWHRFYSHQPDLNFDNPRVLEAVLDVMRYWLDMGVDGLRLDAIPYLIEREGTNCENLRETHEVIKKIRAALDAGYPDRMLLAEANQWPEETAQYFGDADECHMAFHFPLMPRMYMALAQEDRHPITDIMRQTPEIPERCQWAIFLRNHDELTLEMVTDKERDYLWTFYANEPRARINLGIRRRLASLLDNDRRKIELLNSLLLSMPGTPVLYYGDEIGMGDNIYLGDRDGVRTPMQWSPDRNGGFSRTDPARLFLPAIQDPIYGFDAVNVEAQLRSPASLLNWTRRLIAIRRNHPAFGRGTLRFLYPANRKVLAYIRGTDEECILCVVNVSRSPQAVELDLSEYKGCTPVEMTGGSAFPPVGDLPYLLTLPAYGFYWFHLTAGPVDRPQPPAPTPELFTLVLTGGPETIFKGRERTAFERTMIPRFVATQRWFAGKGKRVRGSRLIDFAAMQKPIGPQRHSRAAGVGRDGGRGAAGLLDSARPRGGARGGGSPALRGRARPPRPAGRASVRRRLLGELRGLAARRASPGRRSADRRGRMRPLQPDGRPCGRRRCRTGGRQAPLGRAEQHVDRARRAHDPEALPPAPGGNPSRGGSRPFPHRGGGLCQYAGPARLGRVCGGRRNADRARDPAALRPQSGRRVELVHRHLEARARHGRPRFGAGRSKARGHPGELPSDGADARTAHGGAPSCPRVADRRPGLRRGGDDGGRRPRGRGRREGAGRAGLCGPGAARPRRLRVGPGRHALRSPGAATSAGR